MKVTMEFNPEFGRKILRTSAGSIEQYKIIDKLTDMEVMYRCFQYGCIPYCFENVEIIKDEDELDYDYFLDLIKRLDKDKKGCYTGAELEEYADIYYSDYMTSLNAHKPCGIMETVIEILDEEALCNKEYKKDLENIKKSIDNNK